VSFADDYVAAHEPWWTQELEDYLRAIASMFSEVELLAFDTEDGEGWTILFDPDRCPAKALPYLAQYVGERLPVGLGEDESREWIKDAPNQLRGTPYSIFHAAQRKLSGQRTVRLEERFGDVDHLRVTTYDAETPDPAGTEADVRSVLPHDVILDFQTIVGQTWADVAAAYGTWADVAADNATWEDVRTTIPGGSFFERPR
jgi:hypothetical protein